MKTKKLLVPVFFCVLLGAGCKKDNSSGGQNPPPPPPPVDLAAQRIKTFTITGVTNNYSYDNQGRIVSNNISSTGGNSSIQFSYNGNTIIQQNYNSTNVLTGTTTYTLNGDGYVKTATTTQNPQQEFSYDYSDGRLINIKTKNNGALWEEKFYYYDSDNLVKDSTRDYFNNLSKITVYEYFTDKGTTAELTNFGQPYFGKPNKNCLKKQSFYINGVFESSHNFVPEFDTKGRITKRTRTTDPATLQIEFIYTYY